MIVVTLLCRYAWVVTLQSDIWTRVAMLVNVWAIRWGVGGARLLASCLRGQEGG